MQKERWVVENNVIVVFNMSGKKHAHDTFLQINRVATIEKQIS